MRPCYKSPAYFQVGWSSLQTGSRKQRNRHRVVGVQTGSLETSNLKSSRKCAQKIFKPHQTAEVGVGVATLVDYGEVEQALALPREGSQQLPQPCGRPAYC